MVSKGNTSSNKSLSPEELMQRVDAARASYNRHQDAAAEAVGYVYLLYRDTRKGDNKKWFDDEIQKFNDGVKSFNTKRDEKYERAKKWEAKTLEKDDHLMIKDPSAAQKAENDIEIAELEQLLKMSPQDRSKLKRVSTVGKEGSSKFMPVVRYVLHFDKPKHSAMVSRYCLAVEWLDHKFSENPNADIDQIKAAIETEGGFDCCIDAQRLVNEGADTTQSDENLILQAQNKVAQEMVAGLKAKTTIQMSANKARNGYVLLLARTNGIALDVLGETRVGDSEMDRAVSWLGDEHMSPADPELEFVSRVLGLGETIKDKQEVPVLSKGTDKVFTERLVTMRHSPEGKPQLVVSVNKADACSVLHATPVSSDILTMAKGECVLQAAARGRLEREVRSRARRHLLTMKVNTAPKRADDTDASSPLSWELHNRALSDKNRSSANQSFFWTDLASVRSRPLDVDNFAPEFKGTLEQSDIIVVEAQLLDPWRQNKAGNKNARAFQIEVQDNKIRMICGDADPFDLTMNSDYRGKTTMRFRISDIDALFSHIAETHAIFEISGDSGGLLRVSWSDDFAHYDYFIPTIGADGRLLNRRVAPMRIAAMPMAAE